MMTELLALDPESVALIRAVLQSRIPHHRVWVFGSRVGDSSKLHSDVDLVILDQPAVPENLLALLKLDFEESNLPVRVDVSVWSQIPPSLQHAIEARHVEL